MSLFGKRSAPHSAESPTSQKPRVPEDSQQYLTGYEWKPTADYPTAKSALAIPTRLDNGTKTLGYPALYDPAAEIKIFQVETTYDPFAQKDLARLLPPGEIAIVGCAYYPTLKKKQIPHKRNIGHSCLAIGVEREAEQVVDGQTVVVKEPGVMAIHSPQDYMEGAFNHKDYGSFFFQRLEFPSQLSPEEVAAYRQNIITLLAIANTYIPQAENFDSAEDPLGVHNLDKVQELGEQLILAVYGETEAIRWLKRNENKSYCAELVSAGVNLGTNVILNRAYLENLRQKLADKLGEDRYPDLYEVVSRKILNREFLDKNENPNKAWIPLAMVDESLDLKPINQRCPDADQSGTGLAFMYDGIADIAYQCIRDTYPRLDLAGLSGDEYEAAKVHNQAVARVQMKYFEKIIEQFVKQAKMGPQAKQLFEEYINGMVRPAMETVYPSAAERDQAMAKVVEAGRQFTPVGPDGSGMFVPPDIYLKPTRGWAKTPNIGVGFYPQYLQKTA